MHAREMLNTHTHYDIRKTNNSLLFVFPSCPPWPLSGCGYELSMNRYSVCSEYNSTENNPISTDRTLHNYIVWFSFYQRPWMMRKKGTDCNIHSPHPTPTPTHTQVEAKQVRHQLLQRNTYCSHKDKKFESGALNAKKYVHKCEWTSECVWAIECICCAGMWVLPAVL